MNAVYAKMQTYTISQNFFNFKSLWGKPCRRHHQRSFFFLWLIWTFDTPNGLIIHIISENFFQFQITVGLIAMSQTSSTTFFLLCVSLLIRDFSDCCTDSELARGQTILRSLSYQKWHILALFPVFSWFKKLLFILHLVLKL